MNTFFSDLKKWQSFKNHKYKAPGRRHGEKFHDTGFDNHFLAMTPKVMWNKSKNRQMRLRQS